MRSRIYVLINVISRMKDRFFNHLQIAHLRAKGAVIGKNLVLGRDCRIALNPGAKVTIGDNVVIDRFTDIQVESGAELRIGSRVYIGKRNTISARQSVHIGDNVFTAHDVTILDVDHNFQGTDKPIRDQGGAIHSVTLANDIWIATGVTILAGVKLGKRTVVAAGSVVTKSHDGGAVLAGIPAHSIKTI